MSLDALCGKMAKEKKSQCIWSHAVEEGEFAAGEMCFNKGVHENAGR
jgi:hypothetical protein